MTRSSLTGKAKCKAWDAWLNSPKRDELTKVFKELGNQPKEVTSAHMERIVEYFQILYGFDSTFAADRLNKFRKSTDGDLRKLAPSKQALLQHTKRACFQAGYVWKESIEDLFLPSPTLWGWLFDEVHGFGPCWLSSNSSCDLDKFVTTCSCKTGTTLQMRNCGSTMYKDVWLHSCVRRTKNTGLQRKNKKLT